MNAVPFETLQVRLHRVKGVLDNKSFPDYTYQGNSWYNGFNAIAQKRFSKGFTAAATYTFSKFMERTTLLNPGDALPSKVISDVDAPHHLILSGIYEFPFGHGRKFLSHFHGLGGILVSGWQFSPIYTYQSGFPIALGNLLLTSGNESIVPLAKGQRSIYHWFNTSAFNTASSQQLLDNVRTLSVRFGNLRADAYNYWDASILKDTHIKESILLQFRFEAINALNQVTFAAPNVAATSQAFGQVTAQSNVPRHMQFTLRFAF